MKKLSRKPRRAKADELRPEYHLDYREAKPNRFADRIDKSRMIQPTDKPRAGWAAAFQAMAERADNALLDQETTTSWDDSEWEWR